MQKIGDDALEDAVFEEYINNSKEEQQRRDTAGQSSFFSRMFDFSGEQRAEPDIEFEKAYSVVSSKIDDLTQFDMVLEKEFEDDLRSKRKDVVEISITSD